ncbi:MAG: PqqD family protein [Acidobacteria bacterium]|nr:PqqD family protein [Acidobacteriota bacterium]
MKKNSTPRSRHDELVVQEVDGELLIYDLRNDKAFCLNPTSALVWQACDGKRNVAEINAYVSEKLNAESNEDLVWLAIDQLKKEKLFENGSEVVDYFEGMSRREVIKKIGLGSAISIPIVASLIAPMAVHAAVSLCGPNNNAVCNTPYPNCPTLPPPAYMGASPTCSPAPMGCSCQGPWSCPSGNNARGRCA